MADQSSRRRADASPERKRRQGLPPLVWIVLGLLVAWLVTAVMQRGGTDRTPQGGSAPAQAEGMSVMPPAPASGDAPATPGGVVNGPAQPPQ